MFSYLVVRDWEDFTFRGDLLYWGTFFIFREKEGGGLDLFSIKTSMTNHVISRIVDGKIMFHVCMLTFLTFTWECSV